MSVHEPDTAGWRTAPRRLIASTPGLVALLCVWAVSSLPARHPIRVIAALLLVAVLPGLAASVALGVWRRTSAAQRIALVPALSLALAALISLALFGAGVRLSLGPWADSLAGVTVLACLPAAATPRALGRPQLSAFPRVLRALPWVAASAAVLAAAVLVTTHSVARAQRASHFTTLWVLPVRGRSDAVRIGLDNHEGRAQTYVVKTGRGARLSVLTTVSARTSGTWTQVVPVAPGMGKFRVALIRGAPGDPVYRQVALTVAPGA